MIGIIVSGSAVPTAARTDPTAPSASSSLRPNHSMPFVNSSAPSRITTKATDQDERCPCSARHRRAVPTPTAMTTRIPTDDRDHPPLPGPGVADAATR